MKLSKDKCHICLEEILYITSKNASRCNNESCNGYICNQCWDNLAVEDIETCPLCRERIDTSIYELETEDLQLSMIKFIKKRILNIIINIFFGIYGFLLVSLCYIIFIGEKEDIINKINNCTYLELAALFVMLPVIGMIVTFIFLFFCGNLFEKCFQKN